MSNLIKFCTVNGLNFVPVKFNIIEDDKNEGFYKKSMLPTPSGWKDWSINKCNRYYEKNKSEFILIDLNNKCCVCDCDDKISTNLFAEHLLKKMGKDDFIDYGKSWATRATSYYLSTDEKPIKDAHYKMHFWFKIKNVIPNQKIDTDKKFDVITKHIIERVDDGNDDLFTGKTKSFGKSLYKFCYNKKYIHEIIPSLCNINVLWIRYYLYIIYFSELIKHVLYIFICSIVK